MTNMLAITALELLNAEVEQKVFSKLDGRRNWMICTEVYDGKPRIRYHGTFGEGEWCTTCYLSEMVDKHYRWFYFTYKKDYKEALKTLHDIGYITWAEALLNEEE